MIKTNGKNGQKLEQVNEKWDNTRKDLGLQGPLGGRCEHFISQEMKQKMYVPKFSPQNGIST